MLHCVNHGSTSVLISAIILLSLKQSAQGASSEAEPILEPIHPEAGATEQRLIRFLLQNYDSDARGVRSNSTVTVQLQLLLLRIQGLDERSQVLTTTGLIICDWQDDRLKWNTDLFDSLQDIVIKPERIWLPELALMNGAEELAPDFRKVRVLIRHDGRVHWEPGGVFMTTCDIDIRYFPFDDQSCPIQFGAWAYYSARMNITNSSSEVQTHDFRLNGEWEIYQTKAQWKENVLPCCPDTRYPYVEFTLYLRRRYTFYVMNIILPCTLLSVLVMVVFCLPPDAGEKIALGISVLLAFTVFLLTVAENVPRTSLHIPIIVVYLTSTMGLGTVSVCLTVLVLNLHHRDSERPVPRLLRLIVLRYLARILCVGARKPKTMADNLLLETPNGSLVSLNAGLGQIAQKAELLAQKAELLSRPGLGPISTAQKSELHTKKAGLSHIVATKKVELVNQSPSLKASLAGTQKAELRTQEEELPNRPLPVLGRRVELLRRRKAGLRQNGCLEKYLSCHLANATGCDHTHEWKEIAHVLDRLFFCIVLVFMTASVMMIALVPYYKDDLSK